MFQIVNKNDSARVYTVYAVITDHDAFLVYDRKRRRFGWVPMDEYMIFEDNEKAASAATETARK